MYELNSKGNFEKELNSLIIKLEERIRILSEKIAIKDQTPSKLESSKLNKLKLHYYKMKETLSILKKIYDKDWRKSKDHFQKEFYNASQLLI